MNLLLLLLLAAPAKAQTQDVGINYIDFTCGLNDTVPSHYLKPCETPNAKNWLIDEVPGALVKRKGTRSVWRLPGGNIGNSLCLFTRADGSDFIVAGDGPNLFQTTDLSTHTHYKTNLNSNSKVSCSIINNELWVTNGVDSVFSVNGASVTATFNGSGTTPNIPKGKYIAFEGNRVFIARTVDSPSSIFFSRITSPSDGSQISPSSNTAWATTQEIFCGRSDGSAIYGLKSLNGRVYALKENSIWQILAGDDFSVGCEKVVEGVGTISQDSIVISDGVMKFWGKDNEYSFDGFRVTPIGDRITRFHNGTNQVRITYNSRLWDSVSDFVTVNSANNGESSSLTRLSTSAVPGSLVLGRDILDDFGDGNFTSNPTWTKIGDPVGSTFSITNDNRLKLTTNIFSPPTIIGTTSSWNNGDMRMNFSAGIGGGTIARIYFLFTDFNLTAGGFPNGNGYYLEISGGSWEVWQQNSFAIQSMVLELGTFNGDIGQTISIRRATNGEYKFYLDGTLRGSMTTAAFPTPGVLMLFYRSGGGTTRAVTFDDWSVNLTSGLWKSEMVNSLTTNTGWLNLETNQNDTTPNGPPIQWGIRTADSSSTLSGYQFHSITPGTQVSTSASNTWVQLVATVTVSNNDITLSYDGPEIRSSQVSWIIGGDEKISPMAGDFRRRYLVSISTTGASSRTSMIYYTKSPYSGWMPLTGFAFNGLVRFRDNYYALDSSTNQLVSIFSNDSNTDGGAGILADWQSRDEGAGELDKKVKLKEIFSDYSRSDGSSFDVGVSTTMDGNNFYYNTVGFSGSGRGSYRQFFTTTPMSDLLRFSIRDNSTNAPTKIYGLHPIVEKQPMRIR